MRNSPIDIPDTQPLAYGYSAVTYRTLSRIPTGYSAVAPYGHSAVRPYGYSTVTYRTLSRERTAEYPCKHRYTALIFQHRLNLSAPTQSFSTDLQDCLEHSHAASSAPAARGLAEWLGTVEVQVQDKDKNYRGSRP